MSDLEQTVLRFASDKLQQNSSRIQDCLGRLSEEQIWMRGGENLNTIGNLVLHVCGNMNQWIGTGIGGRPDTRQRDAEFAAQGGLTGSQLWEHLRNSVDQATADIAGADVDRLGDPVVLQGYSRTGIEAILHVMEHFGQHTGQIIFATKLLTGEDLGYYRHLSAQAAPAAAPDPLP